MAATDTIYEVETPEGIMLHMRVAGLTVRSSAYFIDFCIRWGVNLLVIISIEAILGDTGTGLALIFMFFNEWFYPVFFEVFKNGATPGKRSLKLRVVGGDGTPVGWQASIIRNFLLVVDFLPLFFGFGIVSSLLDKRFRRLGDLAADTIVVYEKEIRKFSLPNVEAEHPGIDLTINEQRALVAFGERHQMLSKSRKVELAEILDEVHELKNEEAVLKVQGYSLALAGKGRES
ncbi:MAG: RDD family protein [Lentisphaeraceae bacterium]|nr:RDD family protein [Lentisphaeraceae bacterium]